jgi:hypothetical protein
MLSHKAVRVLAVGIGAVGFLALNACVAPSSDDANNTKVDSNGVQPQGPNPDAKYSKCVGVKLKSKHQQGFAPKNHLIGNSRLSRIERDRVPCIHIDKGEVSTCYFHTDPQLENVPFDPIKKRGNSGTWVQDENGNRLAQVGQRISRAGEAAGDWVVGTVVKDGTVPCIAPNSNDAVGTPDGTELAGECVVETMLSGSNGSGRLLLNYATTEVCTTSNPHPDNAAFSSMLGASYCYKGEGAALNDLNGTERDSSGLYITGSDACHVAWQSGIETVASKRPATKSYPYPGSININSTIVWRPVNAALPIANP